MRQRDIKLGCRYLTRTITVRGPFGPRSTRGLVEVTTGPTITNHGRRLFGVRWLMRDGTERPGMPGLLAARQFLVEVPDAD